MASADLHFRASSTRRFVAGWLFIGGPSAAAHGIGFAVIAAPSIQNLPVVAQYVSGDYGRRISARQALATRSVATPHGPAPSRRCPVHG